MPSESRNGTTNTRRTVDSVKIRTGFVSNSSSSSFVVGFRRGSLPKSVKEMRVLLFNGVDCVKPYDHAISVSAAARRVFDDLDGQTPLTVNGIADELDSIYHDGIDDKVCMALFNKRYRWDTLTDEERNTVWEQKSLEEVKMAADEAYKLVMRNPDRDWYKFDYGDEDGPFDSCMEHGEVFAALPHVRISHH